jgi:thiamine monophosphate synthase
MDEQKLKELNLQKAASKPREYKIEGSPSIGLYFTSPMQTKGYDFPIALGHAFRQVNKSFYEKNMHAMEFYLPGASEEDYHTNADLVSEICKNSGIVFIIKSRIEMIEKYNADGVILDDSDAANIENMRKKFGEDFIIGIDCKSSKDTAQKYIDNKEVDYVTFEYNDETTFDLLEYWKTNTDKPCAIKGYITPQICEQLTHSGVDFIGCGEFVWDRSDEIADAVDEISRTIEDSISGKNLQ